VADVERVPVSKARKILKRTLVGTSLVSTVALLLWWNSTSAKGWPIFGTGAVILLLTIFEVSRMGALTRLQLLPPLLIVALVVIDVAHQSTLRQTMDGSSISRGLGVSATFLYGFAALSALAASAWRSTLLRLTRIPWLATLTMIAIVVLPVVDRPMESAAQPRALIILAGIGLVCGAYASREPGGLVRLGIVTGLATWIIPPLLLVWTIWSQWGTRGLVTLLALSKIGDTCGYYVGSTLGKTHPFPKISPGKTTAGCVGSFTGAVVLGGILWAFDVVPDGRFGIWSALAAGATINIAAQAGDLLKSWTKRRAGVKDSSTIFGPAGGLLDQVDSLLLTVPMACATWPILFPT
jgi:CDP-diglyceride synthetase